jgi:hypothetical protein
MTKLKLASPVLLLLLLLGGTGLQAQRYLTEVFSQVSMSTHVYGSNFTVLTVGTPLAHTSRQDLVMDVYQPVGDAETERPLVLIAHTGNFLPWVNAMGVTINGSCGGTFRDSSIVEIATRLAKMGYVVASFDYRLGWRPDLSQEIQRRFTLINAAYRGVQDARTAIRYFRKNAAEDGNDFAIDTNRIVLWGNGTGGYVSLNTAALDQYVEIINTSEPGKFMLNATTPMVIQAYNGDPYGVQAAPGVVDAIYNAATGFPIGDTLYVPNHIGYSSEFDLAVNMGGALGDKAWLDANTPPIISFHVPADPFAPCGDGTVIVPGFGFAVVNVSGSCTVQPIQDQLGNNLVFELDTLLSDPISEYARTINGGLEGFYPFLRPADDSAPWDWNGFVPTGPAGPLDCVTDATDPRATIDTVMAFYAPRACRALHLDCPGISSVPVGTTDLAAVDALLAAMPNPATSAITFTTDADHLIRSIEVFDANGRLLRSERNINSAIYVLERLNLGAGLYLARLNFDEGAVGRKLIFR